jgi:hypothetical protein
MQNPQELIFKKMQDSHFYGKEPFSGKFVSEFCLMLREPITPGEFLKGSLNMKLNSWKSNDKSNAKQNMSKTWNDKTERPRKTKRDASHSEKHLLREESKRDRTKVSVRSKNSAKARSKLSSKYSIPHGSQSRKAKALLNKNYKLKVSNSKRFKDISGGESPRPLKESKTSRIGALSSKKKLERSLRKHSSKAFKNSRQHSVREKEAKLSKKHKNSSIVSSGKGSVKNKSTLLSSDIRSKKKNSKTQEGEKLKNTYSSKKGISIASRESSLHKGMKNKKIMSKQRIKNTDSATSSKIR